MELLEIRNNLIKLSYEEDEKPTLGHFVALTSDDKSYVAQYVNLKSDNLNNFAVARLMFTFNSDGVVSEFDGSAPSIKDKIVPLPVTELLDLLPVNTPIQIGPVVGTNELLSVDSSIFEHNFTVFSENDYEKSTFISNCVRQLFRQKEKSVIIDTDSFFEDHPCIKLGEDYKLPLNTDFIDFIYNYELRNVDAATKAVIQDIFYAVEQYINTLDESFISIDNFIDVVTAQYKETQMPELALLKNKLLKYKDAHIFANTADEIKQLKDLINERNCVILNVKDVNPALQKELILYVHKILELSDTYIYYFVPLNDDNSDKKLIKRLINHNHVFTTIFASHLYKYASELKSHAQNILLFAPQTLQHDFAAYNTFLNKLNPTEGIIYGSLTQNIPLIIDLFDLELDLTKDDVLGDREQFIPSYADFDNIPYSSHEAPKTTYSDREYTTVTPENYDAAAPDQYEKDTQEDDKSANPSVKFSQTDEYEVPEQPPVSETDSQEIENILDDDYDDKAMAKAKTAEPVQNPRTEELANTPEDETDENLDFMDEFVSDEAENSEQDIDNDVPDELTEEDLDYIENNQDETTAPEGEQTPMVPIFEPEEDNNSEPDVDDVGFKSGDEVNHPRYGKGVVEKIIKYGNKTLCSINFENVGRRLLDPSVTEFEKI